MLNPSRKTLQRIFNFVGVPGVLGFFGLIVAGSIDSSIKQHEDYDRAAQIALISAMAGYVTGKSLDKRDRMAAITDSRDDIYKPRHPNPWPKA